MNTTNNLWLVVDVCSFSIELKPYINQIILENNLDRRLSNIALEYCLITSVSETLTLPVVYRKDSFLENTFYYKLKSICDSVVFRIINKRYLSMFDNQEVKLLFTGNSLFITTFNEF